MAKKIRQYLCLGSYIDLSRGVRVPQDVTALVWRLDTSDLGVFDEHVPNR